MMKGPVGVDVDAQLWAAKEVKAIWISHPHADHHLGVVVSHLVALPLILVLPLDPCHLGAKEIAHLNGILRTTFANCSGNCPRLRSGRIKLHLSSHQPQSFEEFDPLLAGSYLPVNNR